MNELYLQKVRIRHEKIPKDSYLCDVGALMNTQQLEFDRNITFFAGKNGTGKSTLLEAMAVASGFNAEGGSRNYAFSTFDSHSVLSQALAITRGYRRAPWGYFLRAESFYNVATKEIEYSDIGHPSAGFHMQSHGESFLNAAQRNLRADGLYFLDEPEAALSPQRQLTLLSLICHAAQNGAQFFIATHSPVLLGMPDAQIFCFGGNKIVPCGYEETESYKVTELFINHRQTVLCALLDENDEETE